MHLREQTNGIRAVSFTCAKCNRGVRMGANAYMGDLAVIGERIPLAMERPGVLLSPATFYYQASCIPCLTRKDRRTAYVEHEKSKVEGGTFARFICSIDFNKQFRNFIDEAFIIGYKYFESLSLKTLDEQANQEVAAKRLEAARMQHLIFGRSPEASQRYTGLVFLGDVHPEAGMLMPDGNYDGTEEHVKPDPMKWRAEWEQARVDKVNTGDLSPNEARHMDKVLGDERVQAFDLEGSCSRIRREMLLDSGVLTLDEFIDTELLIINSLRNKDHDMKPEQTCPPCKPCKPDDNESIERFNNDLKIINNVIDRIIAASDGRTININFNIDKVGDVSKLTLSANIEARDGGVVVHGGFDPGEFGNTGHIVTAIKMAEGADPDTIGKVVADQMSRGARNGG